MHVVGHRAVGPHLDSCLPAVLSQEAAINGVVVFGEKGGKAAIPRPCDVMGNAGNDDARDAGHVISMVHCQAQSRKIAYCPRNSVSVKVC